MSNLEELISNLLDAEEVELEEVKIDVRELLLELEPAVVPKKPVPEKKPIKFTPPVKEYKGEIAEVQLGATRAEGGSRGSVVKLGGQNSLYRFEGGYKNKQVVSFDVFDLPMPSFPRVLRDRWQEVWNDPAEWAREAVKLGTELVTVHLISTDPMVRDTKPREAAKIIEEVLQAVKVPIIVGGSGNPEKDPLVFEKVAEVAEGEMLLLASANLDLDHKRIVDAANKYHHNVLSFTSMNITDQQALNRLLFEEGLPKDRLVQDPTTGALGYGLDYTYSIIQRLKESALRGDEVLQNPIFCGVTNAWAAREAWMKEPAWGAREYRGLLWEIITAVTVLDAGADGLMMLHPDAVRVVKEMIDSMAGELKSKEIEYENWLEV